MKLPGVSKSETMNYYRYWGKAKKTDDGRYNFHPLYLHSLDVVAVAKAWWNYSPTIRRSFQREIQLPEEKALAYIQFFIALHDLGKLDMRFQNKVPEIAPYDNLEINSSNYDHGMGGYKWFVQEKDDIFPQDYHEPQREYFEEWLAHTAGHHGKIPSDSQPCPLPSYIEKGDREQDRLARKMFIHDMAKLFFNSTYPKEIPPEKPPILLAGFCTICDWLGSDRKYFKYADMLDREFRNSSESWLDKRKEAARCVLQGYGLISRVVTQGGMRKVFPSLKPRNVQGLIEKLKISPSLVIIESSTGSGKTEAAISLASSLLSKGFADGITFALPTQATANAILPRLKCIAEKIFSAGSNVILAHGKSPYNREFQKLIDAGREGHKAEGNDSRVQCNEWLSVSKKRAFLGQIAVTTIDQVLLSAIPSVKHWFVRSFGIGKNILIIDEIHAYDAYMYELLKSVIRQQKQASGSVLLLSATLPWYQKKQLLREWGGEVENSKHKEDSYPLILQTEDKNGINTTHSFALEKEDKEANKRVFFDIWASNEMSFDEDRLKKVVSAVEQGAKVCIICNLVDDAQSIAKRLEMNEFPVVIFHSRYRYKDRMKKEESVIQKYGKNSPSEGLILVGTQVLEQSLDIDCDWLITFLCPIDLLFQRMGRLHRHTKPRPQKFERPLCSLIMPQAKERDYKLHEYIYKNKRVLWRTQQLLYKNMSLGHIDFPIAYRNWIERAYMEDEWEDEPREIVEAFEEYNNDILGSQYAAKIITQANAFLEDREGNASALTREGEMNLTVIPILEKNGKYYFLDEEREEIQKNKPQWEKINQNSIGVPQSWKREMEELDDKGIFYLPMNKKDGLRDTWEYANGHVQILYSLQYGLQKKTKR